MNAHRTHTINIEFRLHARKNAQNQQYSVKKMENRRITTIALSDE